MTIETEPLTAERLADVASAMLVLKTGVAKHEEIKAALGLILSNVPALLKVALRAQETDAAVARTVLPLEPTPAMIAAGARVPYWGTELHKDRKLGPAPAEYHPLAVETWRAMAAAFKGEADA